MFMADGDLYQNAPNLGYAYMKSAFPTAATQFGNVVVNNNVTILADTDHREAATLEFAADDQTMTEMARAGTKYILLESFGPGDNAMFDKYFDGEISDRAMKHIITELSPQGVELLMNADESHQVNALYDLVKNAREQGIRVQGINGMEGAEGPLVDKLIAEREVATLAVAKAIDEYPGYFDLPEEEKNDFLWSTLEEAGLDETQSYYQMMMLGREKLPEGSMAVFDLDHLVRRLEADHKVADRVQEITGGEKSVIIYGEHHTGRVGGDLDDLLGAATVGIYADRERYNREVKPGADRALDEAGMVMGDKLDYTLDFKSRVWRDERNNINLPVEIPGVPSLPSSYEKRPVVTGDVKPAEEFAP